MQQVGAITQQVLGQPQRPPFFPHRPGKGVAQLGQVGGHRVVGLVIIRLPHRRQVIAGMPFRQRQPLRRRLQAQGKGAQNGVLLPPVRRVCQPPQQIAVAQRFQLLFCAFNIIPGHGGDRGGGQGRFRRKAAQCPEAGLQPGIPQRLVAHRQNRLQPLFWLNVGQRGGVYAQALRQLMGNLFHRFRPFGGRVVRVQVAQGNLQRHRVRAHHLNQAFGSRWRHLGQGGGNQGQRIGLAQHI